MNLYFDTSVLVSLFIADSFSAQADRVLRTGAPLLIVSDLAAAEFASVLSRRVRTGELAAKNARTIFQEFDEWTARETQQTTIASADVAVAATYLRRLDSTLRTPDAIHVAIAQRIGAHLLTFDKKMAAAARRLGTDVAKI